jgi:beta-RFAP synthase
MPRNSLAAGDLAARREQGEASVEVFAPARLHLGFLDLDGGLGRRYGGIGMAIDGIGTRLALRRAEHAGAEGIAAERALDYLARAAAALALPGEVHVAVPEAIPEHAGLGSGTQLGLAVAAGLCRLHRRPFRPAALAAAIERRPRSGIGIGAFESGGFLVDGGRSEDALPSPVIARLAFPAEWRLVLVLDHARHGLHGSSESAAFATLPAFGEALAGRLCRLLVMRLLPGLAIRDFTAVAAALGEIQERLGDYFSGAQHGRFSSPAVAEILAWLRGAGIAGIGQSSWGPTGFALLESAAEAKDVAASLRERFGEQPSLEFRVVSGRNRGAEITVLDETDEER